jgi:hypothetical protein
LGAAPQHPSGPNLAAPGLGAPNLGPTGLAGGAPSLAALGLGAPAPAEPLHLDPAPMRLEIPLVEIPLVEVPEAEVNAAASEYLGSIHLPLTPGPIVAMDPRPLPGVRMGGSAGSAPAGSAPRVPSSEGSTAAASDETPFFPRPGPGDHYVVYVVKFPSLLDYSAVRDRFHDTQRIELAYHEEHASPGDLSQLRINLPGRNMFEMYAVIERVEPNLVELRVDKFDAVFVLATGFLTSVAGQKRLQGEKESDRGPIEILRLEEQRPADDPDKMPIRLRISRMSMEDKINLALSGNREERMALATDTNKAIHHYLLKNAKMSLDEISFMARMPTLNPDVLGKIAENPAYTQNPQVVKSLVYNPKTPIMVALRLLDRLPRPELLTLSKRTSMNARLIQAAKKKYERG